MYKKYYLGININKWINKIVNSVNTVRMLF